MKKELISKRYIFNKKIPFYYSKLQKEKIKEFEKKISLKNKEIEECYICKNKDFIQISEKDKYGFYYPVAICKKCSLVQVNPYYNNEEVSLFYTNYFRQIYMGRKSTQKYIFNNNIERGKKIISFIEEKTDISIYKKNILDIGCGNGGILMAFKNKENNCVGIDLGSTYFNEGLKNNLDLKQTSLNNFLHTNENKKFDIIIFSHNLEHLINPLEELNLIKSIINKNTIIFISVPGIFYMHNDNYDFLNEYFQNAHKSHFSLETLSNLNKIAGFELIYGDEEIKSLFRLKDAKQNIIFNDYKTTLSKIIKTEKMYNDNFGKIIFIKTVYFILDKLGLRILFLNFLNKINLTKFLRKFLLNEK